MERQFRLLARAANVLPLEEGLDMVVEGRPLPARAVAITFDDGYRDTLTVAAPLLRRFRLHATVFLVPGLLAGTVDPWWETAARAVFDTAVRHVRWEGREVRVPPDPVGRRAAAELVLGVVKTMDAARRAGAVDDLLGRLKVERSRADRMFLDWDDALALSRHPCVSIGSHTLTHPVLANESADDQRVELAESRRHLREALGTPVRSLSYPVGTRRDISDVTVAIAREVGYDYAVTTAERVVRRGVDPWRTPRFVMSPERGVPGFLTIPRPFLRALVSVPRRLGGARS